MSLRYIATIGIFFALLVGGFFVVKDRIVSQGSDQNSTEELFYSNAAYNISFSYPSAYILSEMEVPGNEERAHYAITLMRKEDMPLPEAGEGPPSITINVYQNNSDVQTAEEWIRNSSESNVRLGEGVLTSTTISGLPALSYRWSGLYEGTTIVRAQPDFVYAFTVTYLEMGAPIVQDFVAIRDSVRISE